MTPDMTRHLNRLRSEINAARRAELAFTFVKELALAVSVLMVLDYLVHFDDVVLRRVLLLAALGYAVWKVVKVRRHPVYEPMSDMDLIRLYEKRYPQIQGRWIAAYQLRESPLSAHFVELSTASASELPVETFVRWGPLKNLGRHCGLWVCGLALAVLLIAPLQLAWARLYSDVPWPQVNALDLSGLPTMVPRGEPFSLTVRAAAGMSLASETVLILQRDGDGVQELTLSKNMRGELFTQVDGVEETVDLVFQGGDFTSAPIRLEVVDRPRAIQVAGRGLYPDYVGLPDVDFPVGKTGFSFLDGAHLELSIETNKTLKQAWLETEQGDLPLTIDGRRASATVPIHGNGDWIVRLTGEHGFDNRNPLHLLVEALADQPPQVVYASPRRDLNLLDRAFVEITGSVRDDYGVERIEMMLDRVDVEGNPHPQVITLDASADQTRAEAPFTYVMDFAELKAVPGEVYKFTVAGTDFLGQFGMGRQVAINIVHPETFNEELDNQMRAMRKILERMIAREKTIIEITSGIRASLPRIDTRDMALAMEKQNSMTGSAEELFDILEWVDQQLKFNRLDREDIVKILDELGAGLNAFLRGEQITAIEALEHLRATGEGADQTLKAERACLEALENLLNEMGGAQGFMEIIDQVEKIIGVQRDIGNQIDRIKE